MIATRAPAIVGFTCPLPTGLPSPETQRQVLQAAGATIILGAPEVEPGACLASLRDGDLFAVAVPHALAPTIAGLLAIADDLDRRGVSLAILDLSGKAVQFSDAAGQEVRRLLAAVVAWEEAMRPEAARTAPGRPPGRCVGRPATILPERVRQRLQEGARPAALARELGIARSSVYRCASGSDPC